MSDKSGKRYMTGLTGSTATVQHATFTQVVPRWTERDEETDSRWSGGMPASFVVVRNMAFFADKSGFLWACGDFDMTGGFEWDYAFNMGLSLSAQYGGTLPDEVDAFVMRVCALVWDAMSCVVPFDLDSGR